MEIRREIEPSMFIAGEWVAPKTPGSVAVINPANGEVVSEIGYGGASDARQAVEAADEAFSRWSKTTARERADILNRVAQLLRERQDSIGRILAVESGKRLAEAVGEVRFAAEYFQWFAEEARRPNGAWYPEEGQNRRHWSRTQPAGVALCLTPWNFPVSIQARKLAPALAAGCTVVARASQKAPLSVIELFRCLDDAGIPAGVANLVQGPAAQTTEEMMRHPAVRVVSFTGSTAVGQALVRQSAHGLQRLALELGGNAPFIVFDDADLDKAADAAMIGKFRNNGQSCIAANRLYVHERVIEEFVEKFSERIRTMQIGDPLLSTTGLGPVIDADARDGLLRMIDQAVLAGAHPLIPSMAVPDAGYYMPPMLLANVSSGTAFACDELFGPCAPVFSFRDEEEVIEMANDTNMGLAAYAFTSDAARATRVTESLDYGIVGLNHALPSVAFAPMGGFKMSGIGREGARVGMEEFLETKYVSSEIG